MKGLRWRVSNRENIKVFDDSWVPGIDGFKINWKPGVDDQMRVCDLLSDSGGWNIERFNQVGTVQEQNAILDIPIVHSTSLDRQVWQYNRNGAYSVKSGYWLALKSEREQCDGSNGAPVVTAYWRHLWKLKMPPKMLHFQRCLRRCCIFCGGVQTIFCRVKLCCFGERLLQIRFALGVNKVRKRPCTQHGNVLCVLWSL